MFLVRLETGDGAIGALPHLDRGGEGQHVSLCVAQLGNEAPRTSQACRIHAGTSSSPAAPTTVIRGGVAMIGLRRSVEVPLWSQKTA
eukprot:9243531-Pyramimonas_sp.AAC.1